MEIKINGMWQLFKDPRHIGEDLHYFLPDAFPENCENYWAPQFHDAQPFLGTNQAWIKKEFELSQLQDSSIYNLVSFGADLCRIWLNGKYQGSWERKAGKQVLEMDNLKKGLNTIIIQFTDIHKLSLGLWKDTFIMQDTTRTRLSEQHITHTTPSWVEKSVIYCVYTRNFSVQGDFKSVTARLKEIKELGADVLWLLPIHPIGKVKRKGDLGSPYSISDYYAINPEFGTKSDFKELVDTAHNIGLKVIIDLVINHTAKDSVMKELDPHFYKSPGESMADAWGWTDVSDLDYNYPPTRTYISDMMLYWIKEYNLDGFRCDVAFLVPGDFWTESIQRLRDYKPDILMLAESDHPDLYLTGFDLTYDWGYMGLLRRVSQGYFQWSDIPLYLDSIQDHFPYRCLRMICTENHDTDRAAHQINQHDLIAIQALKFFTPGIPLIYNGEEGGISHRPDLFTKDIIPWKKSIPAVQKLFQELSVLRHQNAALQDQTPENTLIEYSDDTLIIKRSKESTLAELQLTLKDKKAVIKINKERVLEHKKL